MTSRLARVLGVAAAVAALSTAAACGSSDRGSGSGSISLWHGFTDAEATAMTSLVGEWNTKHPKQKVQLVFNSGNDNALQKTNAALVSGKYPDIAYEYGSAATSLARKKQLVDLTSTVKDPSWNWQDFYPGERQAATIDGKVVGLPALVDNLALVYNKSLFDRAGIAYPTASWTWDEFRSAAAKLTSRKDKRFGWAYVDDGSEDTVWRFVAMLWQGGGDLLDSDGTKAAFDSDAGLSALQLLHDMAVEDRSVYLDSGSGNYLNLFNSGRIAMMWTGPWDLSSITDPKYGVQVLPGQTSHASISGPDSWMLFDNGTANVATAKAFMKWFLSPSVHLRFAIATGDLPLRASEEDEPDYSKFEEKYPASKVFVANQQNVTKSRPVITEYPEISAALGQAIQSVLAGKSAPGAALAQAKDTTNGLLQGP